MLRSSSSRTAFSEDFVSSGKEVNLEVLYHGSSVHENLFSRMFFRVDLSFSWEHKYYFLLCVYSLQGDPIFKKSAIDNPFPLEKFPHRTNTSQLQIIFCHAHMEKNISFFTILVFEKGVKLKKIYYPEILRTFNLGKVRGTAY
jgi:hypothetical protein